MPSPGYLNSKINIMRGFDFDKALVALQNELHCFAYKLTADKDEAENLLQETMLRTLDNKDKFDSGT
ncbi:RNA polymerase sigma factor, partial [Phocaeicola dorei]